VSVNWTVVFNRLFKIIDMPRPSPYHYSGPIFIQKVQEVQEDFPNYYDFLEIRRSEDKSTTRRDYFKDVLWGLDEEQKRSFVLNILDDVEAKGHPPCTDLRSIVSGVVGAPVVRVPRDTWNAERLTNFLRDIDLALEQKKPERVLTLAYTCSEGFFLAYVRKHVPAEIDEKEITALARIVKEDLRVKNKEYPGEVFNVITQAANAINRVRDRFSESHFGNEADLWMAMYIRDLVNTHVRLLLHFM
jgi:hypothetical protein